MDSGYNDYICLGIDASGSRCGLALVGSGMCRSAHLIWYDTVHADKSTNPLLAAVNTVDSLVAAMTSAFSRALPNIIAIEDPTGFAYATALHHTKRTTNSAAIFGFPWMMALSMIAVDRAFKVGTYVGTYYVTPLSTYSFQPSQWQSRLGCKDFYPMGEAKDALRLVMDDRYPEKNRKHIIRAGVATLLNAPALIETKQLRSKRYDWVVEQDGVDAAGIAIIGIQEHTIGNPKAASKKPKMGKLGLAKMAGAFPYK